MSNFVFVMRYRKMSRQVQRPDDEDTMDGSDVEGFEYQDIDVLQQHGIVRLNMECISK